MKLLISIIVIAFLSFAVCIYLPWWSIAIVSFAVSSLIRQMPLAAFVTGFFAVFLLWSGLAWWISIHNHHILAHRVSLIILQKDNPYLLILATALIGGLVSGFASLAAVFVRIRKG
ncbi:MAG: hypothetical protein ABJA57_04205 [Ginsengibacter sp.]